MRRSTKTNQLTLGIVIRKTGVQRCDPLKHSIGNLICDSLARSVEYQRCLRAHVLLADSVRYESLIDMACDAHGFHCQYDNGTTTSHSKRDFCEINPQSEISP